MSRANESAYPIPASNLIGQPGMSIREAFAMAAMQGLLANGADGGARVAELSVAFADHLILELSKVQS